MWQPIETMPKDIAVLVGSKDGGVFEAALYGEQITTDCGSAGWVTHWRPMPDPPTEDGPTHEELYGG